MSDPAPSVSSEEAPTPAGSKHMCRKCNVSFPSRNTLHYHLQSCGKSSPSEHHCRCAAVETELQEIKGLLATVLASKPTPELNPSFTPFRELKQLQQESPLEYARRLEEEFLKLPVIVQYQKNTRYHLYEHIRASTPDIYPEFRAKFDTESVFDIFKDWIGIIEDVEVERKHREAHPGEKFKYYWLD